MTEVTEKKELIETTEKKCDSCEESFDYVTTTTYINGIQEGKARTEWKHWRERCERNMARVMQRVKQGTVSEWEREPEIECCLNCKHGTCGREGDTDWYCEFSDDSMLYFRTDRLGICDKYE